MEKNSHERRAYELVDDGSPSWVTSQKWTENKIQAVKGGKEVIGKVVVVELWRTFIRGKSSSPQSRSVMSSVSFGKAISSSIIEDSMV